MNDLANNLMETHNNRYELEKALCEFHTSNLVDDGKLHYKIDQILLYVELMIKWNKTYNLTALKNFTSILDLHIVDSLIVIPKLDAYFQTKGILSPTILDVGSGAGLPGVVLAVMRSNYRVCCLDAVEKKTAFVTAIKSSLGLSNLTSKHGRIEQQNPLKSDIVISRAFASIGDFVHLAQSHVADNGRIVAMKAKTVDDEVADMTRRFPHWKVTSIDKLILPNSDLDRCLVWLQQEK